MKAYKRRLSFFSILFTFFVDNLGWSIVFPIFAPLFLDPNNILFTHNFTFAYRTAILGFFLAAFPLAQFFGSPILGEFADNIGRKKALIISIFLTFLGYLLTGWSIQEKNLIVLFFARFLTGLFSGNLSVCLASISDLSANESSKAKNFGFLSALGGFSFIIGAFLGGKLSDPSVNKIFSFQFPIWIAAFLSFLNLLFIIFFFRETFIKFFKTKYKPFEGIENIKKALETKGIKKIYLIYFLFVFAWTLLFQFSPVLVIKKFNFSNSQIGDLAAFMGICWIIGSAVVAKILSKFFKNIKILEVSLLVFTILSAFVGLPKEIVYIVLLLGSCVLIGGVAWPICTSIISNKSGRKNQGKIMGVTQSMQSLAMTISPVIGGLSDRFYIYLPFIIAGFASFIAAMIYLKVKLK